MHGSRIDLQRYDAAFDAVLDSAGGEFITIPDAHLLFSGDFKRSGDNLKIIGEDGKTVLVPDYFKADRLPILLAPDGAALTGDIVSALAGPRAPGQYAQAGAPASGAQEIGRVATIEGNAVAIRNGVAVTLNVGDAVLKGDVVQTQTGSTLGITFADGSTFNMTASARMVLNEFVYNPASATNSALINLVQGSFTFIAGEVAKTGDMKVSTPVATMGIRGTAVQVDINLTDGTTKMSVLVEPNGTTGSFNVYSLSGNLIGTVNNAGVASTVSATSALNAVITETQKTPAELQQALVIVQQVVQTQAVGKAILAAQPVAAPPPDGKSDGTEKKTQEKTQVTEKSTTTIAVTVDAKDTDTKVKVTAVQVTTPTDADAPKTVGLQTVLPTPPVLTTTILDKSSPEDTAWVFNIPFGTFAATGILSYKATLANGSALPAWLTFNAATQTFSGTPPQDFNGVIGIEVTATATGLSTSFLFSLIVTPVNDLPTITSVVNDHKGDVVEDANLVTLSTTGTIKFRDVDLTDTHTASFVLKSSDAAANLPGFAEGVGVAVAHIGAFTIDPSVTESGPATWSPNAAVTGTLGWKFELPDDDPVLQSLAAGQTIVQVYTVTVTDSAGTTAVQDVTITITGTNDAPVITSLAEDHAGGVTEDTGAVYGNLVASDTIRFLDLDLTDTHTATFVEKSSLDDPNLPGFGDGTGEPPAVQYIGTFALNTTAIGVGTDTNNTGAVGWTFTLANDDPVLQSLAAGQTIVQVYTVTVTDSAGTTAVQDVTITITGTNDAPVITSLAEDHAGGVTEDTGAVYGNLVASDTIRFLDLDLTDTHTATFVEKSSLDDPNLPGFGDGTGEPPAVQYIGTFALNTTAIGVGTDTNNTGAVGWTFTLANDDPVLQSLAAGQTIVQVYTVTVTDSAGTTAVQDVTITITGTNDAPVITSLAEDHAGGVTEDTGAVYGNLVASDTIRFLDLDLTDTHTATFVEKSSLDDPNLPGFGDGTGEPPAVQYIGTFALNTTAIGVGTDTNNTGAVGWTFTLANDDPVLQSLAAGQTIVQVYTVTVTDSAGTTAVQDVTITITGTNDAPVITSLAEDHAGGVTEDTGAVYGNLVASDTIRFLDLDLTDTHTATFVEKSSLDDPNLPGFGDGTGEPPAVQYIGTFALNTTAIGVGTDTNNTGAVGWTFTLANDDPVLQSLAAGQTIVQVYTVTVTDSAGTTAVQDVTITITGTNDAPVITSLAEDHAGGVTEDTGAVYGNLVASDTIRFLDLDLTDTHTATFVEKSSLDDPNLPGFGDGTGEPPAVQYIGTFALNTTAIGVGTDTNNTGAVGWTFTLANDDPVLQSLAAGQTIVQVYTVTVTDSAGTTAVQDVTITITGTNDAPVITSLAEDHAGGVTEDTGAVYGNLVASDTIRFLDLDLTDTHTATFVEKSSLDDPNLPGFGDGTGEPPAVQYIGTFALNTTAIGVGTDTNNTGAVGWTFTLANDDPVLQSLAAGQTIVQVYTVTVTDSAGTTAVQDVTITITGTNDAPVITSLAEDHAGGVTEDTGAVYGNLVASDTIRFLDLDLTDTHTATFVEKSSLDDPNLPGFGDGTGEPPAVQYIGTFALNTTAIGVGTDTNNTGAVGWTFTLANDDPVLQSLAAGQTIVQVYTVTVTDSAGTTAVQDVTITITGTNDAPVITSLAEDHAGGVTEDTGAVYGNLVASDTIRFLDLDLTDTHTATFVEKSSLDDPNLPGFGDGTGEPPAVQYIGTFALNTTAIGVGTDTNNTGAVGWTFTLANDDPVLQSLAAGQTIVQVYTVTVTDSAGTTAVQDVTITITGTNDAPVITSLAEDHAGGVTEDTGAVYGNLVASDTIRFLDLDLTDTHTATFVEKSSLDDPNLPGFGDGTGEPPAVQYIGTFALNTTAIGVGTDTNNTGAVGWTFTLANDDPVLQSLAAGQTIVQVYTVTVTDSAGTTAVQDVTITITGTNDAPVITSLAEDHAGGVTEDTGAVYGNLVASDTIRFLDLDLTDTHTATFVEKSSLDDPNLPGFGDGTGEPPAVQYIGTFALNTTAIGVGTDTNNTGAVGWTFTLANDDPVLQSLAAGQTIVQVYTVTVTDSAGTTAVQDVTITITGTNDAPVITSLAEDHAGGVTEDTGAVYGNLVASDTIRFLDLDLTDTHTATFVEKSSLDDPNLPGFGDGTGEPPAVQYIGTFALNTTAIGVGTDTNNTGAVGWTFTLANDDPVLQSLAAGQTIVQVYTVTVTDSAGTTAVQDVTITITGTNDAPVITSLAEDHAGGVTEDTGAVYGNLVASDTIRFLDLDLTDTHTATFVEKSSLDDPNLPGFGDGTGEPPAVQYIGTFALNTTAIGVGTDTNNTGAVGWTFTLANDDPVLQSLAAGQTIVQVYTVTVTDSAGTTAVQDVTITITGTNDAPVITSLAEDHAGGVTEDTGAVYGNLVASDTIRFLDLDLTDTHTATFVEKSSLDDPNLPGFGDGTGEPPAVQYIGTFALNTTAIGVGTDTNNTGAVGWTFTLANDDPVLQSLAAGQTIVQVYTVTVTDSAGTTAVQDVTITITGTNDAPVITSLAEDHAGGVTEDTGAVYGNLVASDTIRFLDLDLTDTHTATFVEKSSLDDPNLPGFGDGTGEPPAVQYIGTFALNTTAIGVGTDTNNTGAVGWTFTLANDDPVLQSLAAGQTIVQVYTVTVTDSAGTTAVQDVTITITGTNDAPVITSLAEDHAGGVTEDTGAVYGNLVASDTIRFLDLDLTDTHTATFVEKSSLDDPNLPGFGDGTGEPPAVQYIGTFALNTTAIGVGTDTNNTGAVGWTFTLANDDPVLQSLAAGQTIVQVYTVTVTDSAGTTAVQDVTITITGTNDAPVITSLAEDHAGGVTEDTGAVYGNLVASDTIRFLDLDLTDTHTATFVEKSSLDDPNLPGFGDGTGEPPAVQYIGTFALNTTAIGVGTDTNNTGAVGWTFTLANDDPVLQSLAAGQTIVQVYTVTVTDSAGTTAVQDVTITITGTNDAPVITSLAEDHAGGVTEDTGAVYGNLVASDTIRFLDLDLTDTHTATFVEKSSLDDPNLPGFGDGTGEPPAVQYIGTFALNTTAIGVGTDTNNTGAVGWTFTLANDDPVLQSLAAGQTIVQVYTVTVTDSAGTTAVQDVTITITGTNDAPVITSLAEDHAGGVTEDTGAVYGNLVASDTIRFLDLDLTDTHTATFVEKSSLDDPNLPGFGDGTGEPPAVQYIGTFALNTTAIGVGTDTNNTGAVGWTFTLANDDPVLQSLAAGQTIVQVYTVTVTDSAGTTAVQDVTITITGTNDAPVITSLAEDHAGGVTEDTGAVYGNLVASDTIRFLDLDLTDTHTATFVEKSSLDDPNLPGFGDGTGEPPAVQYIGTFALNTTAIGVGTDTNNTGAVGWTFTLANDDPVLQSLAAGQTIVQVYTVTVTDSAGTTAVQDVTITITGTNDAPVITSLAEDHAGGVTEDTGAVYGNLVASDTIRFLDLDLTDTHTATFVEKSSLDDPNLPGFGDGTGEPPAVQYIGTFALNTTAIGVGTDTNNTGAVGWTFTLANDDPVLQSLAAGQTIVQVYTVTVTDSAGTTAVQDVTITITGTNDAPVITSLAEDHAGGVTEDTGAVYGNLVASDTIRFLDLDLTDTHTATFVEKSSLDDPNLPGFGDGTGEPPAVQYIGTFALNTTAIGVGTDTNNTGAVGWTFTLANDDPVLQSLAAGQTIVQVYTVTVTDSAGTTAVQDVTITITGTNDAPVITSLAEDHAGGVTEDTGAVYGNLVASDTIRFLDLDLTDTHTATFVEKSSLDDPNLPGFGDGTGEPPAVQYIGTFALNTTAIGVGTDTNNTGAVGWTFTLANDDPVLQSLAAGQTIVQVYTVTVTDSAGTTAVQDVTITITGTNDAPVIVGQDIAETLIEDVLPSTVAGQLVATDVDYGAQLTWSVIDSVTVPGTPTPPLQDYRFALDRLTIERAVDGINPHTFLDDTFDNTNAGQGPTFFGGTNIANYLISGSVFENNGYAFLDGTAAIALQNLFDPLPRVGQNATLQTDVTGNPAAGLKSNMDFTVDARFDLVLPQDVWEQYGIRLSDAFNSDPALRDSTVGLMVRRVSADEVHVVFTQMDFFSGIAVELGSVVLNAPAGADQIVLRLSHAAANPGIVTASFDLLDDGAVVGNTTQLAQTGTIFNNENAIQVQYLANGLVEDGIGYYYSDYFALTLDQDGNWMARLRNGSEAVQALAQGQEVTEQIIVRSTDEHGAFDEKTLTFTAVGSNDAPTFQVPNQLSKVPNVQGVVGGNQVELHSAAPDITPNGRYVAFSAVDANPNQSEGTVAKTYLYDRVTTEFIVISDLIVGTQGVDYQSTKFFGVPSISADGRYVAFQGNWWDGQFEQAEVFVYDRLSNQATRLSDHGATPSITDDGALVAMENGLYDGQQSHLLVRNLAGNVVLDIFGDAQSAALHPSINGTGRFVSFWSAAETLTINGAAFATGNADPNIAQVYVYDRVLNVLQKVSVNSSGMQGNGDSGALAYSAGSFEGEDWASALSANGRYVVFQSNATNLVANDNNGRSDIFVFDRDTQTIQRVSIATGGAQANGDSYRPSISPDGRFVIFASDATNLVAGDTNNQPDTFIHDRLMGTTIRLVGANGLQGAGDSSSGAAISGAGMVAAFGSTAALLAGDTDGGLTDVYVVQVGTRGFVAEDSGVNLDGNLTASGQIAFRDVDLQDDGHIVSKSIFAATDSRGNALSQALQDQLLAAFQVSVTDESTGDGTGQISWSFAFANSAVQHLAGGEGIQVVYQLTLTDDYGASSVQNVLVMIGGQNDAPVINGGAIVGNLTEDSATASVLGQLTVTDPDDGATQTWKVAGGINGHAANFSFAIDNLKITRNGSLIVDDEFVTAPVNGANYAVVNGDFTAETVDGRTVAVMDQVGASLTNGIGSTTQFVTNTATRLTGTDAGGPTTLAKSVDFVVEAKFNLTLPDDLNESYGIRLTDQVMGGGGDDVVELRVTRNNAGGLQVQLRQIDFTEGPLGTANNLQSIGLSPADFTAGNQIVLRFSHTAGSNIVSASFDLLNSSGAPIDTTRTFNNPIQPAEIFRNEDFTQVRIQAVSPAVAPSYLTGTYGTLSVDAAGNYNYSLLSNSTQVQALGAGQTVQDNFTIQVTDDQGAVGTKSVTINVTGVNDRPVVNLNGPGPVYFENAPVTQIAPSATVTDIDSANFAGGSLTVSFGATGHLEDQLAIRNQGTAAGQIGVSGSNVTFAGTTIGTFSGGANGSNLVVSFNANATPAAVTELVRNILYSNTSEAPFTAPRSVTFTVVDGDGGQDTNFATATIGVVSVNDAPVFSTVNHDPVSYTENDPALVLFPALTLSDPDNPANFNGGQLQITMSGTVAGDELLLAGGSATQSGNDILVGVTVIGTVVAGSLAGGVPNVTINLNSNATAGNVSALVQALAFHSTSDNPTAVAVNRGVTVMFSDGGNTGGQISTNAIATIQIDITPVDDVPTLTGFGPSVTFAENAVNAAPALLDADVTFTGDANGGVLTLSGLLAEDRVAIRHEGTGAGQIGVSGATVTFGGVTIGTIAGGVGATLTVAFNGAATSAAVDALIQNLTYANVSDTPTANRTLILNVSNASGAQLNGPLTPSFVALNGGANPFNGVSLGQAAPSFVDLDGDGDLDGVVGQVNGTLWVYLRNVDNTFTELWSGHANNPFNSIAVNAYSTPSFVDIDGDSDLDAVVGTVQGTLNVFLRNGNSFTEATGPANPFGDLIVSGGTTAPSFIDLDGDGDQDLVLGNGSGTLRSFRHNADHSFTELTGSANPFNGVLVTDNSAPSFVDLDGDGDLDLVVGDNLGTLRTFRHNADHSFTELTGSANPFNGIDVGSNAKPSFVDLDGDGDLDAVVGGNGSLFSFANTTPRGVAIDVTVTAENDAPTLTAVDALSGIEDTARTITYADLAAAANESDVDSANLSFRVEAVSSGTLTKNGQAVEEGITLLSAGEELVWTPAANANGTLNAFTIVAWDGAAASASPVQVQVNVAAVNDAPVAHDVSFVNGGSVAGYSYFGSGDGASGHWYKFNSDNLSWTDAAAAAAAAGGYLATITSTYENDFVANLVGGSMGVAWIGASDSAEEGTWRWMYGPEQGLQFWSGGLASSGGVPLMAAYWRDWEPSNSGDNEHYAYIVGLAGTEVFGTPKQWNDAPDAAVPIPSVIEFSIVEDTVSTIPAAFLLDNVTDVDSNSFTINSVTATANTHGTVALVNGNVVYTPEADFSGTASFEYTVKDAGGAVSNTATITFTVQEVGERPVVTVNGATTPTFMTLDMPDHTNTMAEGINDAGQIVGQATLDPDHQIGWKYEGGIFTTIVVPGTQDTSANDINESGVVTGDYSPVRSTPRYGYTETGGVFTQIDSSSPGASTSAIGINDSGIVVGASYLKDSHVYGGYIKDGASFTILHAPGTSAPNGYTVATDINNANQVVGTYTSTYGSNWQGFLYQGSTYTTIASPDGVQGTYAQGINDLGQIAGWYTDGAGKTHGYVYSGGIFTTIDNPLGANGTVVTGINDAGQVVGYYTDGSNAKHSFVASLNASSTAENTPVTITTLSVSDADAGSNPISVVLAVDNGSLALVNSTGITTIDNIGTDGTLSFTGSQTAINAALAKGVTYTPTAGFNGEAKLTIGANDGPGSGTAQVIIPVTKPVNGTTGNDTLTGTAGYDTINGGAGDDILSGLAGKDTFQFSPNFGNDTITDFTPGEDIIEFAASMFANQQAILDATQDVNGVAVITHASHDITLNVSKTLLDVSDFRLV